MMVRQRDWLGHAIQVLLLLATIGLPLAYWAITTNATMAQILTRLERQEKDISDQRQDQRVVTQNLVDASKTLARIDTQLEIFRENRANTKR
ncbi:MAG TPA: hypothetical protein VN663_22975 [Ramlibacter sp.]|nr:hypothetical protein [Ramlibacter sp.]